LMFFFHYYLLLFISFSSGHLHSITSSSFFVGFFISLLQHPAEGVCGIFVFVTVCHCLSLPSKHPALCHSAFLSSSFMIGWGKLISTIDMSSLLANAPCRLDSRNMINA
jgi:hypothetical protein